jgi:MoaA/NifB/PqqE/SkfB family radical SAM enzyme
MRAHERARGLWRTPELAWDILVRGRYAFTYDSMAMVAEGMSPAKRMNLLAAGANLLHRRLHARGMPLHMQFELTNACTLRCPVCPTGSRSLRRATRMMDVALFEQVIDEVGPTLLTASLWVWGEPLLHPELRQILRAARRHGVITLLSTNGQRLDDEKVQAALLAEPPDVLIVALDGLTDETNSTYRVGARLAPVLAGVRRLADAKRALGLAKPALDMRFIVMRHNRHELPLLDEFAARNGFEQVTIRTLYLLDSTADATTAAALAPTAADRGEVDAACRDIAPGDPFICFQPFWFPSVFADGTVVLCEQDYNADLALGRVGDGVTFRELWFSERAARLRGIVRDRPEDVAFCRECLYLARPVTDGSSETREVARAAGRQTA